VSQALATALVSSAVAIVVGWVLPALAMMMLVPSLQSSPRKVRNYRGAEVPTGLGIVWMVWAMLLVVGALKIAAFGGLVAGLGASAWTWWVMPALLVVLAFTFGLIDDAYGAADAKGFKGHLKAMLKGRLTTGGLKLVGIGLAALVAAFFGQLTAPADQGRTVLQSVPTWVLGALVIALAANLVNLMDLRPGRALKAYSLLAVLAVPGLVATALAVGAEGGPAIGWPLVAVSVPLLLGPVAAVWRYDLGERGMLGDAGANAMGALAGYIFAVTLPLWGLALAAAVLVALNLLSEKVSFSSVIEGNAILRWIDGLGRTQDPAMAAGMEREHADGGSAASSDDNGEADTRKDGAN